jgi:hypothetical protein
MLNMVLDLLSICAGRDRCWRPRSVFFEILISKAEATKYLSDFLVHQNAQERSKRLFDATVRTIE